MFNKDLFTDDPCTSGGQKFYSEIRSSRNGRFDKLVEVKTSTQYLPKTNYSSHSKSEFKISSCNHFQDLNEKFQELESKMFEVEKCFKEVNKREMDEVQRLMNDQSESESIPRSRLFEVGDGRKEMSGYPADGIKRWLGHHNPTVTEKRAYEDRIVGDGSGDTLVLPNKASSEVSCKTMIKTTEKSPVNLSNRHGNAKGIFTIPYQFNDEPHGSAKQYTFEETNKQTTDVDFLEKSKKLILTLIDKELKKIETKPNDCSQSNVNQEAKKLARDNDNKNLKIACINKIERELSALKKLESLEQ